MRAKRTHNSPSNKMLPVYAVPNINYVNRTTITQVGTAGPRSTSRFVISIDNFNERVIN